MKKKPSAPISLGKPPAPISLGKQLSRKKKPPSGPSSFAGWAKTTIPHKRSKGWSADLKVIKAGSSASIKKATGGFAARKKAKAAKAAGSLARSIRAHETRKRKARG